MMLAAIAGVMSGPPAFAHERYPKKLIRVFIAQLPGTMSDWPVALEYGRGV